MAGPSATSRDDLTIDLDEARAVLAGAARRTAELLRSTPDAARPVRRSQWTVAEVGAHLSAGLWGFAEAVGGNPGVVDPYLRTGTFAERLAAVTAGTLELEPTRDPRALAERIGERADRFLAESARRAGTDRVATPWYGEGASLSLAAATGLLAGEQLVHGWDVAMTLGRPWPISPAEAALIIRTITSLLPLAADPAATARLRATYGVTARKTGPRFVVAVDRGAVAVQAWGARPVDCHLSADPVTFVLVGYGRIGQWGPIARGGLRAWGRRPWLALRFTNLFFNP